MDYLRETSRPTGRTATASQPDRQHEDSYPRIYDDGTFQHVCLSLDVSSRCRRWVRSEANAIVRIRDQGQYREEADRLTAGHTLRIRPQDRRRERRHKRLRWLRVRPFPMAQGCWAKDLPF